MKKENQVDSRETDETKTKVSCDVPPWLLKMIDESSRKHAECGRAVVIRMALYSFFGVKD